jgi:flagellar basal-body rod modification protein FlgD
MPTSVGNSTSNGLPIDSLINSGASSAAPAQTGSGSQLGEADFLTLLTTQLQNQNPLSPMDDTQTVTQLAQFSALQAQTSLTTAFQQFQSNFSVLQSASLLGHNVNVSLTDASGNSSTATGTVAGLQIVNGQPQFTLKDSNGNIIVDSNGNPQEFTTSQITGINS